MKVGQQQRAVWINEAAQYSPLEWRYINWLKLPPSARAEQPNPVVHAAVRKAIYG